MSLRDLLGSPVVKNLPSKAGGTGSILGCETKIPDDSWQKKKKPKVSNRSNIVTDSIKTFKKWSRTKNLKKCLKKEK